MQLFPINGPCEALQAHRFCLFSVRESTQCFIDRREQCTSDQEEIIKFDGKWNNDAPSKLPARTVPGDRTHPIQCDRIQIVLRRYCSHLNKAHCKMALSAANIARIDATQWKKCLEQCNSCKKRPGLSEYECTHIHTAQPSLSYIVPTLFGGTHYQSFELIAHIEHDKWHYFAENSALRKSDAANILISNRPTHCVLLGALALRRNKYGMSCAFLWNLSY